MDCYNGRNGLKRHVKMSCYSTLTFKNHGISDFYINLKNIEIFISFRLQLKFAEAIALKNQEEEAKRYQKLLKKYC